MPSGEEQAVKPTPDQQWCSVAHQHTHPDLDTEASGKLHWPSSGEFHLRPSLCICQRPLCPAWAEGWEGCTALSKMSRAGMKGCVLETR